MDVDVRSPRLAPDEKTTPTQTILRVAVYLSAVLLVLLTFSVLCAEDAVTVTAAERGVNDLRDFDFGNSIARIPTGQTSVIYPGAFYTSEDFATGNVTQEGNTGSDHGDYGTIRMVLLLPLDEVYAISAKSVSYAQRLFVDGKEIAAVGNPTDDPASFTPGNRRYVAGFHAQGEATEIILHYSVFVHADGGGRFPLLIGSVENIARAEQLRTLLEGVQAAALLTALLFFFGLFLFFPGRRYLLWFALLCCCIAVQLLGANNNALMLLLPEVSFTLYMRLSYLVTCGIGLTSALYMNCLFPGAANKWAVRGFAAYCGAVCVFLCLAPTTLFTRFPVPLSLSYVAFLAYLLAAILIAALRRRLRPAMTKTEGLLLLSGMALYIGFLGVAVYAHQKSWWFFGWEYQSVGIMVFLFLNVLALTLVFSRTEQERDAARAAQREIAETNRTMERLNHTRALYFANITHEIKTPLAAIRTAAQYCKIRLERSDGPDGETLHGLDEIARRAGELSDYTVSLLKLTAAQDRRLDFAAVDVAALLAHTTRATASVLRERGNRLTVDAPKHLPPLSGVFDLLAHELKNLIANANRFCANSEITLTVTAQEDGMARFCVTDRGAGIPAELLPRVFARGVSADGGTGLGLAICKEVVETHGGMIHITSRPGQGTQVWFTIPFAKEDTAP